MLTLSYLVSSRYILVQQFLNTIFTNCAPKPHAALQFFSCPHRVLPKDEDSSARYTVTYIRIVFWCFSFIHRTDNLVTGNKDQ